MATRSRCSRLPLLAVLLLAGSGWLAPHPSLAQARLNLALEMDANRRQPLLLWSRQATPDTGVGLDTIVFTQGRSSLHLTLPADQEPAFAQLYTLFAFPVDSARGHMVTVSAWVRTGADFTGQAGVYAYAHTPDEDGKNRVDNVVALPPAQAWRRVEVSLPVKATATAFGLGLRATGRGQVWFDDVQVRLDGRLFGDAPQAGTESLLLRADELAATSWAYERLPAPAARPAPTRVALGLDSGQVHQGRYSLRAERVVPLRPAEPAPVLYLGTLPVDKLRGQLLTVHGWWQQDATPSNKGGNAPVFTYTFLGNDGRPGSPPQWSRGVVALPTSPPQAAWTPFTLTIPLPADAFLSYLTLGLRLGNTAPVRVDDVQFLLDGRPYVPAPPATPPLPTPAEVAWLRQQVVMLPLAVAPTVGAAPDWRGLGSIVGAARLVGLGEVTHGSGSIFRAKGQLIEYLAAQKGFTAVALETSADCGPLEHYLQTGQGEPQGLLAAFGVWNTQEVLDLLRTLRRHNQQHPASPVHLAGVDMQRPDLALQRLQQATPATDEFSQTQLRALATRLGRLPATGGGAAFDLFRQSNQPADTLLQALLRGIGALRTGLDTRAKLTPGAASPLDLPAYLHELRVLEQGILFRRQPLKQASDYRDACLAENVEWLSRSLDPRGGAAKVVFWAHNAHVATAVALQHPAGEWLKARFGPAYLAIGLAFGQGSYAAEAGGKFYVAQAQPARAGTYEAWFQAVGPGAYLLDIRPLKISPPSAWLFEQQLFRDIGIQEAPRNFTRHQLPKEFDAVLFLPRSVPAQHL
jgi:erythromycin esterase-like protein